MSQPTVVYVGGAGRSGSTLLGELLGAQSGALHVGELSLFWRDASRGGVCACGQSLLDCELWGQALMDLRESHGVRLAEYQTLAFHRQLLARSSRPADLMRMRRRGPASWTAGEERLVSATDGLVRHVLELAKARVLVDSSKTLASFMLTDLMFSDVRLIHLVRDPRAVVASARRSRSIARGNLESLPPGAGTASAMGGWMRANATMRFAQSYAALATRVNYEDLIADPQATLTRLSRFASLEFDDATVLGDVAYLPGSGHAAVGNPIRGGKRVRTLRLDERWRTELPASARLTVGTVAGPLHRVLSKPSRG